MNPYRDTEHVRVHVHTDVSPDADPRLPAVVTRTVIRALKFAFLWLLALVAGCAPTKGIFSGPSPSRHYVAPAEREIAALDLRQFDGYAIGTVANIASDWRYDDPCKLPQRLNPAACDGTATYRVQLTKGPELWAFVPQNGNMPLREGESGVFLWRWQWVAKLGECAQWQSLTRYCPTDTKVQTVLVVLPLAMGDAVAAAWGTRGR